MIMAIGKALEFVKNARTDREIRKRCVGFATKAELLDFYRFDEIEFDDAINMQLVKCQTIDEAESYQHLRIWFSML